MPYDRFLIAPFETGMKRDEAPWLIPDEAFTELTNSYVWRGRVRKRFGSEYTKTTGVYPQLNSRLRVALQGGSGFGVTTAGGDATGFVPGNTFAVGQMFSIGDRIYTVTTVGAPAAMLDSTYTAGSTHTFNTTTGEYSFTNCGAATQVYFYPALPVMGFTRYDKASKPVIDIPAYAFDTQFIYKALGSSWERVTNPGTALVGAGVGITDAAGAAAGTVPGGVWKRGQFFSIGTTFFKVNAAVAGVLTMLKFAGGTGTVFTYDIGTGIYNFTGCNALTQIYFYDEIPLWTGTDSKFFCAYPNLDKRGTNLLFISNYNANATTPLLSDKMVYYDEGAATARFEVFKPFFEPSPGGVVGPALTGPWILTTKIITQFHGQLLLLNTIEATTAAGTAYTTHVNRCRYSFVGDPTKVNAFYPEGQQDNTSPAADQKAKGGGYVDIPTNESIVSATFLKDRLIVYCERSTWELIYTGDSGFPFEPARINTELGSRATRSAISFDDGVLAVGDTGVHGCNGINVVRIDQKIPDQVFTIELEQSGSERICGIRDFSTELVYWSYPISESGFTYPDKVLVYNYKNKTWSINDDCITAFGYYQQSTDTTWADMTEAWAEARGNWNDGYAIAKQLKVVAGNQEGYVFLINPNAPTNAMAMQITQIVPAAGFITLTIINHTLDDGQFIYLDKIKDSTYAPPVTLGLTVLNEHIFKVIWVSADTIRIVNPDAITPVTGTYAGAGIVSRVSEIQIATKQMNPYLKEGKRVFIAKVDFIVDRTNYGEITVDYSTASSINYTIDDAILTGTQLGTNVLETFAYPTMPFEATQTRLYHPVYFQSDGECVQFFLYLSEDQMLDPDISLSDFTLEGLVLWTQPTGKIL